MKIKISILSPNEICNLLLDEDKNFVEYNGLELNKNINKEIEQLVNIVSSWTENYTNPVVFDAESFKVEISHDQQTKRFFGCGNYPKNYGEFKNLIKEIISCF
ncbi:MAG: hypothetical protein ACI4TI_02870 [Christensenellales bacterium]